MTSKKSLKERSGYERERPIRYTSLFKTISPKPNYRTPPHGLHYPRPRIENCRHFLFSICINEVQFYSYLTETVVLIYPPPLPPCSRVQFVCKYEKLFCKIVYSGQFFAGLGSRQIFFRLRLRLRLRLLTFFSSGSGSGSGS